MFHLSHGFPFGPKWALSPDSLAILAKVRYSGDSKPFQGNERSEMFRHVSTTIITANELIKLPSFCSNDFEVLIA